MLPRKRSEALWPWETFEPLMHLEYSHTIFLPPGETWCGPSCWCLGPSEWAKWLAAALGCSWMPTQRCKASQSCTKNPLKKLQWLDPLRTLWLISASFLQGPKETLESEGALFPPQTGLWRWNPKELLAQNSAPQSPPTLPAPPQEPLHWNLLAGTYWSQWPGL